MSTHELIQKGTNFLYPSGVGPLQFLQKGPFFVGERRKPSDSPRFEDFWHAPRIILESSLYELLFDEALHGRSMLHEAVAVVRLSAGKVTMVQPNRLVVRSGAVVAECVCNLFDQTPWRGAARSSIVVECSQPYCILRIQKDTSGAFDPQCVDQNGCGVQALDPITFEVASKKVTTYGRTLRSSFALG